jgi:hypothetical protein
LDDFLLDDFVFVVFRFVALVALLAFFADFFFGTFLPSARASDNPIAIACLRLVTFFLERPLFSVPALRFFIARSTLADAFLEYFRAMFSSLMAENNFGETRWFHRAAMAGEWRASKLIAA